MTRQGDTARAIVELRQLARESDDPQVRYDLIAILDWEDRSVEVIDVWRAMGSPIDLPDYVRVALVDALIDQAQWEDANKVTEYWLRKAPDSVDALFFQGQILQAQGHRVRALGFYQRAQRLAPDNQKIRSRSVALLTDLGAVSAAARLIQVPSPDLKASLAAQQVRWGMQVPPPSTRQTYDRLDAAITSLRSQIADVSKENPENIGLLRRLHADLAVALSDRQNFIGVNQQLQYLENTGGIPGYVRVVQGDTLLALREPEKARAVFETVLAEQPSNRQAQQGLLGALIALGDWSAAYVLADSLEPKQTLQLPRSPVPYANDGWLDARLQSILIRSWAGQNERAWEMINPLLAGAPAEPDVQITAATVAAARGLPRSGV